MEEGLLTEVWEEIFQDRKEKPREAENQWQVASGVGSEEVQKVQKVREVQEED